MDHQKRSSSGLWYVIGGVAIGTVLGLLLAPKKGSELVEDLGEWSRNRRAKNGTLFSKLMGMVPLRVKAAATIGAAKAGGAEAIREAKENLALDGAVK